MGRASPAATGSIVLVLLLGGCSTGEQPTALPTKAARGQSSLRAASEANPPETRRPETRRPETTGSEAPAPTPEQPASFDSAAALSDVRLLAGRIGPRLATGPAYRRAGQVVQRRFERLGYDVRRETFHVPGGDSWGVPVEAGRSFNVVAEPPGFDPSQPHVVLGAHLDTVALAPGAEDNASGIAVLLEVARLAASQPTRLPAVLVAFGAEEPRGPGDDMHHFGSRHQVEELPRSRKQVLRAMVSLDRVGVGSVVPVCIGPLSPPRVQRALLRTASQEDIPAQQCQNTASDHWSFEKAGFAVARLGSTSYAAYHSPDDVPSVVSRRQLGRTGRLVWAWLSRGG